MTVGGSELLLVGGIVGIVLALVHLLSIRPKLALGEGSGPPGYLAP